MSDRILISETHSFVLSVNDGNQIDRWLVETIVARGAALLRANSTQKAVELLTELDALPPDLVITNLRRKEGYTQNEKAGIELASTLRRMGHKMPIILYSSNLDYATKQAAKQAGITHVTVIPDELRKFVLQYT